MTTAYSALLGLALPVQGELSGTWGDTVNAYITNYLDAAVAGTQTISTDADVTLTKTMGTSLGATSSQYAIINCTGVRTLLRTITAPSASKMYIVINATTGGLGVKLVGVGPTAGVTVANGTAVHVAWNGADFVAVSVLSASGIVPVANGGTGRSTVGTSGNVLTSNGTGWDSSPIFAAGTRMPFAQAAAPTGWVQDTTDNATNRMFRVVNGTGNGVGGTDTPILNNITTAHTHTFTSGNESAAHTHAVSDPGHVHYMGRVIGSSGGLQFNAGPGVADTYPNTASAVTGITLGTQSANHTHSGTTASTGTTGWAPRYIDLIICAKS